MPNTKNPYLKTPSLHFWRCLTSALQFRVDAYSPFLLYLVLMVPIVIHWPSVDSALAAPQVRKQHCTFHSSLKKLLKSFYLRWLWTARSSDQRSGSSIVRSIESQINPVNKHQPSHFWRCLTSALQFRVDAYSPFPPCLTQKIHTSKHHPYISGDV